MTPRILVQTADFDVGYESRRLGEVSKEVGGIATFIGRVRDVNEGDSIGSLYLEHYPGMTEKQIGEIIAEAEERWMLLSVTVIHRIGQLAPGEQIVFVGVASQHRGMAFDACEFIMDYLKTKATFWKKEQTEDGDRWLDARETDFEAAGRWGPTSAKPG